MLDYKETFAPVTKMMIIRTLLYIDAVRKWEVHQIDVHDAFLHTDLQEEVHMKLPPGFSRGKEVGCAFDLRFNFLSKILIFSKKIRFLLRLKVVIFY